MAVRNQHGGDIYNAVEGFGIKREELLDFSANINPLGISPKMRETLIAGIDELVDYPDPFCGELTAELAKYLGVDRRSVIAGNGASELIYLLFDVLRPQKLLLPAPCFSEYARAAAAAGTEVCYYELKEQEGFRLDTADFISRIGGGIDAVLLCNPNNPTSVLTRREELHKIIVHAKQSHVKVIVDEAFIELTEGGNKNSVSDWLESFDNLYIIRAMTKIMAIPGLRLGYAAGDAGTVEKMQERKLPWSVNTFACKVGKLLNEDQEYFEKTAAWLSEEKNRLYEELSRLPLIKVYPPATNFILIRLPDGELHSAEARRRLMQKNILVRNAENFRFLDSRFIRVAVKDRKSNESLVKALKEIL